ncbi:MAG: hypothetical protein N2645_14440 [Clostridia bacterium]|nr:hypothetical protein [Clostridia bacterium]
MIDAGDSEGLIGESSVIKALDLCKTMSPQVIAMCFSFESISVDFVQKIQSFIHSGALICASVDPVLYNSYPQNLYEVISVDEQNYSLNSQENIILMNDVFYVNRNVYRDIDERGSSLATGYFAGHIARILEFNPLATFNSIKIYYLSQCKNLKIENRKNNSNAFYLIYGQHEISEYFDMMADNYLYYYDDKDNDFKDRANNLPVSPSLITEIDIICGDDFAIRRPQLAEDILKNTIKRNYWDNFTHNTNIDYLNLNSVKPVQTPSICIGSYGMNMDKMLIQLYLNKYFKDNKYNVGNISFNPIAHLFGYTYITYPYNDIHYPHYLYYLNDCMYKESINNNLIITSMAGYFDRFFNFEHRFGDTSHMVLNIHTPDIIILSLSDFIEITELRKVKQYIEKNIGAKMIAYVSSMSREDNAYTSSNYNIRISEVSVEEYCKEISLITKIKAFSKKDLVDDSFFKYIFKLLS